MEFLTCHLHAVCRPVGVDEWQGLLSKYRGHYKSDRGIVANMSFFICHNVSRYLNIQSPAAASCHDIKQLSKIKVKSMFIQPYSSFQRQSENRTNHSGIIPVTAAIATQLSRIECTQAEAPFMVHYRSSTLGFRPHMYFPCQNPGSSDYRSCTHSLPRLLHNNLLRCWRHSYYAH